jgi:hypothetical protein
MSTVNFYMRVLILNFISIILTENISYFTTFFLFHLKLIISFMFVILSQSFYQKMRLFNLLYKKFNLCYFEIVKHSFL